MTTTASKHTGKPHILIVDDAAENLRILSELLRKDYRIMFAKNGEDALRIASEKPEPDLILLDVIMPGMSGYDVCGRLKQDPVTRDIPVMFITAQDNEENESYGLTLGAEDYIKKPFQAKLVSHRIANQIKIKQYRDNLKDMVDERTKDLLKTQEVTIHAMANLAEWRDPETGGHIKRTQRYVETLARHMANDPKYHDIFTEDEISMLYLSAPLHDVGKVAIPDAILLKPGKLTQEEFEQMKEHTTKGHEVLSKANEELGNNSFLQLAHEVAYSHHERWDGKGYPQGLAGEEIPLSARLMSVADVYDALRSPRVYKPPMTHEAAREIIISGKGAQFAPDVVDAFIACENEFQEIEKSNSDLNTEAG